MSCSNVFLLAKGAVRDPASGNLDLPLRRAIWRALGPKLGNGGVGRERRYDLARSSVQKVLPIWNERFPGNNFPLKMLGLAEAAKSNGLRANDVKAQIGKGQEAMDRLNSERQDAHIFIAIGYAAIQVMWVAIEDEQFSEDPSVDAHETQEDSDPEMWDTAYCCSIGAAGGGKWMDSSSSQRRREFWCWWIETAEGYLTREM